MSPAGVAYLVLRRQARTQGRNTEEPLQLYVLEGFLVRLSSSTLRERFVLKGGVLLATLDARRPTRDVDLAALDISNDADTVLRAVREVLAIELPVDDGIAFEPETATSRVIREEDEYAGVRVNASARIATAHVLFHVDVNVGDPVWPVPVTVQVSRLLGGSPIEVLGYSLSMVHAEKIVTAVQRGTASTRWRDFGDVWTLALRYPIRGVELRARSTESPLTDTHNCSHSATSWLTTRPLPKPSGPPGGGGRCSSTSQRTSPKSSEQSSRSLIR